MQQHSNFTDAVQSSPCHHSRSEVVYLSLRVAVSCTLHLKLLRALQPGPPKVLCHVPPPSDLRPRKTLCQQPVGPPALPDSTLPSLSCHTRRMNSGGVASFRLEEGGGPVSREGLR